MVTGDSYFFAVHVHQPFRFAKKVSDNYYKVEISNATIDKVWSPDVLFDDAEFKIERDKRITSRLFSLRDDKYRHFTKQE
jgi:hypothetical protein